MLCAQLFLFCFMNKIGREECSTLWKIIMKNDHSLVLLAVWVFSPRVFGQVNQWLLLKLHEIIRVLHVVASLIIFILFDNSD